VKKFKFFLAILLVLAVFGGVAALPDSAPLSGPKVQTVYGPTAITTDTYSSNFIWGLNKEVDFFYTIDQTEAATNTTSIKLYVSPRAVTWYAHNDLPVVLADNSADASGYVDTTYIQGFQYRLLFDVTNSNTVTVTVVAVLRN